MSVAQGLDHDHDHDLVHAHLARWARERGHAVAIATPAQRLDFAALLLAVEQRAAQLHAQSAAATVQVDVRLPVLQQVLDFLGIVASGRCAAVGDAEWSEAVGDAVRLLFQGEACSMPPPLPQTAFYTGFTSGSSGRPKGFRRSHQSWTHSFRACLQEFGPAAKQRILVPGSLSHSLFLFGTLLGLWTGAGVVLQQPFSAAAVLEHLRTDAIPCLVAVPSQLLLMLELAALRKLAPLPGLRLIMVSGARWPRQHTAALKALFPEARVIEFYGASELSFVAWTEADAALPDAVVGRPFANVEVQIRRAPEALAEVAAEVEAEQRAEHLVENLAGDQSGLIYVRSPMLFMDYVGAGADDSACLRDGDWLSVRDMGYLDAQGRLCLQGRQNRMIVTRAKKLFPEELESVLQAHPAVARASVQGTSDALRGQSVVALIQWSAQADQPMPTAAELGQWCRSRLQAYKVPRRYFVCNRWAQTASGKTDHRALGQVLAQHLAASMQEEAPCLQALR